MAQEIVRFGGDIIMILEHMLWVDSDGMRCVVDRKKTEK